MPEDVYLNPPQPKKPKPNQPIEIGGFEAGVSNPEDGEAKPEKPATQPTS